MNNSEIPVVPKYLWSKTIKEMCENKCCFCGKDIRIEAHHIKPKRKHPELENALENGIALCHDCHLKAHGGSYYNVHLEREIGIERAAFQCSTDVADFVDSTIVALLPKGRKAAVEAHAKSKGESVNGLVNSLLRKDMALTETQWKQPPKEEG